MYVTEREADYDDFDEYLADMASDGLQTYEAEDKHDRKCYLARPNNVFKLP